MKTLQRQSLDGVRCDNPLTRNEDYNYLEEPFYELTSEDNTD